MYIFITNVYIFSKSVQKRLENVGFQWLNKHLRKGKCWFSMKFICQCEKENLIGLHTFSTYQLSIL